MHNFYSSTLGTNQILLKFDKGLTSMGYLAPLRNKLGKTQK